MKNNIVTGCTPSHISGVIALFNSLKKEVEWNFDFQVYCTGEPEEFKQLEHPDIELIFNVSLPCNPSGRGWGDGRADSGMPSMYNRILIPNLSHKKYSRSMWMDADTIAIKDFSFLWDVDMHDMPVAMSLNGNPWNKEKQMLRRDYDTDLGLGETPACQSGIMLFDNKKWMELQLTDMFIDATLDKDVPDGAFVVQSYLGWILRGNFVQLPFEMNTDVSWLAMAKEMGMLKDPYILHYIGGGKKLPWTDEYIYSGINFTNLWKQYYNEGKLT
jgi:lipopolysaccharide biosynthesis glycosyltransferase